MMSQALELQHQQELLLRNLTVQEEERQRIAAQLHDDIGSQLGVLSLTFHRLRRLDDPDKQHEVLHDEVNSLIAKTLDATRRISHALLPPTLEDFGLAAAIEELCETVRKTETVAIDFECTLGKQEIGDSTTALHLFRVVQELLHNSLKYAAASHINILLETVNDTKRLVYRDDGIGFDPAVLEGKGLGMKNLENRAKMIGGNFQMVSAPGKGFEATINF